MTDKKTEQLTDNDFEHVQGGNSNTQEVMFNPKEYTLISHDRPKGSVVTDADLGAILS